MRGLPPQPADVASLELAYDVDGSPASTDHWVFVPGLQTLDYSAMRSLWTQIIFNAVQYLVPLMAAAGSIRTCRLARAGSAPLEVVDVLAPNHGAGGGCQVLNAAMSIYWVVEFAGRGRGALTRLPALPDDFTDDHVHINTLGYSEIGARARDFLNAMNAVPSPAGGTCTLVTLHRQAGGVPLAIAEPRAIVTAVPAQRVATLRRRLNASRWL